ncbi:MAG TPA: hypothetical protein VF519_00160 [Mycobacteriales bacterium]
MTTAPAPSVVRVAVPGSAAVVEYVYDDGGLAEVRCGGRVYLTVRRDALGRAVRSYGDGLAEVVEEPVDGGLARTVRTASGTWTERYLWNDAGLLSHVDGVDVRRDAEGRVVACVDGGTGAAWRYDYDGRDLVRVTGPHGVREVERDGDGRAIGVREARGDRAPAGPAVLPPEWYRDDLGRLWTVTGDGGRAVVTYLWDGLTCFGRIDGPPGEPLAAYFSVDPGRTPVRFVTRDGATRVPRDAYGEALLAHPGLPGLYGGGVHAGLVHLPLRAVDPETGSFTAPDPLDGGRADPRRGRHYRGPLPSELAVAGPYAVCRHDPVGRSDPSGGISGLLVVSDFTLSLQNNLFGWLFLDLTVNLVGSIPSIGTYFDYEGLSSSPALDVAGLRRGGILSRIEGTIFTLQHLVFGEKKKLDKDAATRVVVPGVAFTPAMLGSMLRVAPTGAAPFLLRGDATLTPLPLWSRAGGTAVPVVPGSPVPAFPEGGLHLDAPKPDVLAPRAATLAELVPAGEPVTATLRTRTVVTAAGTGLGLAAGGLVLLTGTGSTLAVAEILSTAEQGGSTRIRLHDLVTGLPAPVRLRALGPRVSTEALPKAAADRLDVAAATKPYARGDVLRLLRGGTVEGHVRVRALEARLALDARVPASVGAGFLVFAGVATGPLRPATIRAVREVEFDPANVPAAGTAVRIVAGAAEVGAIVTGPGTSPARRALDTDLTRLGAAGTAVTWEPLLAARRIGSRAGAPEAAATLTYTPDAVATAPASGYVVAVAARARAVLRVTGRTYDVLVTEQPLPPSPGPFDVERYLPRPSPDVAGVTLAPEQLLTTTAPLNAPRAVALRLQQHTAPDLGSALVAPPVAAAATVAGTSVTNLGPVSPSVRPGEVVALVAGAGAPKPVAVRAVTLTVELDRDVGAASGLGAGPLEAVGLRPRGPAYEGQVVDPRTVTVMPRVRATRVTTRLPRFGAGECVEVDEGGGTVTRQTVASVEGSTLTFDPTGPALTIPAGRAVTVTRLVPANPGNGSARLALAGRVDPANARKVTWEVWDATTIAAPAVLAVTDGTKTRAVQVAAAPAAVTWGLELAAAPGNGVYALHRLNAPADTQLNASFGVDGSVLVPGDPAGGTVSPGADVIVVTGFAERRPAVAAALSSGGVRVPDGPETFEVDLRQSTIDHELVHTLQAATWGPWFLAYLPIFAVEALLEGTTDVEKPEFSPYVAATLEAGATLRIPNPGGTTFEAGDKVEVSAAGSPPARATLGAGTGGAFVLSPRPALPNGPVSVRRFARADGTDRWETVLNVGGFLTPGGLMNFFTGTIWGLVFRGVAELAKWAEDRLGPQQTYAATVEPGGAAVRITEDAGVTALRNVPWLLVQQAGSTLVRSVTGGDDARKVLSSPVPFEGDVRVARFERGTPDDSQDWRDWFPARVDPARPAALAVERLGDNELSLHVDDRVDVSFGTTTMSSRVTAVSGATVELRDPVLTGPAGREVRVAKTGEADQMGWADSYLLEELGVEWIQWGTDPFGQLQYRTHPEPGSTTEWMLRVLRYGLGTQSWGLPGRVFWDTLFRHWFTGTPHNARLEQEAGSRSGALYSLAGRLRARPAVPGDIGRYWFHQTFRGDPSVVDFGGLDAPVGVNMRPGNLVIPRFSGDTPSGAGVNRGAAMPGLGPVAAPNLPGSLVAEELTTRDALDPRLPAVAGAPGFAPSDRGWIPAGPATHYSSGSYVSFAESGRHRITVNDGAAPWPSLASESRDAQENGAQKLLFDVDVVRVDVRVGGADVVEAGTSMVTLVPTQRAKVVVVVPAGAATSGEVREWQVTTTRPVTSPVLGAARDGRALEARAVSPADEPAEVRRVYRPGPDGRYTSGGLAGQRVHLGGDVVVPIRSFRVRVVDTLPFRTAPTVDPADPESNKAAAVRRGGDVFLIVPTAVVVPPTVVPVTYPTTATPVAPVVTALPAAAVTGTLAEFVGDGHVYKVTFPAAPVPARAFPVRFVVETMMPATALRARLTAEISLTP